MPKRKPGKRKHSKIMYRSGREEIVGNLLLDTIEQSQLTAKDLAAIRMQMEEEKKAKVKEEKKIQKAIKENDQETLENYEIDLRLREQSRAKSGRDWLDKYQEMILED